MSPAEFKTWLGGFLEGLAGRELTQGYVDGVVRKIESAYGQPGAAYRPTIAVQAEPAAPTPVPPPEEVAKRFPPKKRGGASPAKLENSTPVADKVPYTPDDPTVVRLG